MIIRVTIQREGDKELLWDHLCRFNDPVYFPVVGGIIDAVCGRVLGYLIKPIYPSEQEEAGHFS